MAWNEPGNNGRDPWGGGNRNDQGPPDLDEVVKKLQQGLNGLFGKSGGGSGGGPGGQLRRHCSRADSRSQRREVDRWQRPSLHRAEPRKRSLRAQPGGTVGAHP